jgi:prepilin-type N-terminal cleavage/methylation domain-containing protein
MTLAYHEPVGPERRASGRLRNRAFSLIEVLVAVALMSVIVLGLLVMFSETQRAFRMGVTQSDVMESGRAALEMMSREMEQAQATDLGNAINFYVGVNNYVLPQSLTPSSQVRSNILQDVLFCTREGQAWKGIQYSVLSSNSYIGTLYRFETNASQLNPDEVAMLSQRTGLARPSRVIGGVVNLRVNTFDSLGRLLAPGWNYKPLSPAQCQLNLGGLADGVEARFFSNALPAYVEIELGILEAKTADRVRNMPAAAQWTYLEKQAGRVQVFRQRIPIRNADPSVFQ